MYTTKRKQPVRTSSTQFTMKPTLLESLSLLLLVVFDAASGFQQPVPGLSRRICTECYEGGIATTPSTCIRPKQTFSATRLNYRDSSDEFVQGTSQSGGSAVTKTSQRGWWSRLASSNKPKGDTRQDVVDDYLEFLEKRYQRMHSEETESRREPKFSAWKWLAQGSDDVEKTFQEQTLVDQENALYALGVAGLASQRLLQKHQLPVPKGSEKQESFEVSSSNGTAVSAIQQEKSVLNAGRLVASIASQRQLLLRFQNRKLRALAKLCVKVLKSGPRKVLKHALELGGGKKTVIITVSALATILLVVARPLAHTIVREGANHA